MQFHTKKSNVHYQQKIKICINNNYIKLISLLRFVLVPLLKVILLSLVLLYFRVAFKVSIFAKSLVHLSSELRTTGPQYGKLFLWSRLLPNRSPVAWGFQRIL